MKIARSRTLLFDGNYLVNYTALKTLAPARLTWYALSIVVLAVIAKLLAQVLVPPAPSRWHQLIMIKNVLLPTAIFFVYARLVRFLEQRTAREVDIQHGSAALIPGIFIGCFLMSIFVVALWGAGMAHISLGTGLTGLPNELLVSTVTALGEELLFRAILFRILEEMTGTAVAIFISAAIFGLSHSANPGATPLAIAMLSLESGVLLALAYALTRNIWLAVGIHMSWNFTEGFIFGLNDSGLRDPHSLLLTTLSGSDLITGGRFGPEGSILLSGFCLVVAVAFAVLIARKGTWWPARFTIKPQMN